MNESSDDLETIEKCPYDPEHPYTMIRNDLIRDNSISPDCRMMLIMLLSNVKNWRINIKGIQTQIGNHWGKEKILKLVKEAIEAGYMIRYTITDKNLIRYKYRVSETTKFKNINRNTENPDIEKLNKFFRCQDFQDPEIRTPENPTAKEETKEEETKKENLFVVDGSVKPPPLHEIKFKGKDAKENSINESDVLAYGIRAKKNWRIDEITYALKALADCKAIIYDVWRFIEGTIEKYKRTLKGGFICKTTKTSSDCKSKENGIRNKSLEDVTEERVLPNSTFIPKSFSEAFPDFPFGQKILKTCS